MRTSWKRMMGVVTCLAVSGCSLVVGSYEVGDAGSPTMGSSNYCTLLTSCCNTLPTLEALDCNATSAAGIAAECEDSVATYCSTSKVFDAGSSDDAGCSGGGACPSDDGGTTSSCDVLAECCPTLPSEAVADCTAAVSAGVESSCTADLEAAQSAGYCGGSTTDGGTPLPESGPPEEGGTEQGNGAPCSQSTACASEDCATSTSGGTGFCSQENCSSSSECTTGSYTMYCSINSESTYICFPGCSSISDCAIYGSDYTCSPQLAIEGETVSMCVSAAVDGAPCNSTAQCSSGQCANGSTGTGFCTSTCSTSEPCTGSSECIPNNSSADICFPSCATDCSIYGSDFTCQTGTNVSGVSVSVCASNAAAPPHDAGSGSGS